MNFTLTPVETAPSNTLLAKDILAAVVLAGDARQLDDPTFKTQARANALAVEMRKIGGAHVRTRKVAEGDYRIQITPDGSVKPKTYKA